LAGLFFPKPFQRRGAEAQRAQRKFSRKKRQVRKLCFNNRDLLILFTNKNSFCAFRVFITGFLPFTLRAALRAFKNFPEIFVAATTYKKLCVLCAFAPLR